METNNDNAYEKWKVRKNTENREMIHVTMLTLNKLFSLFKTRNEIQNTSIQPESNIPDDE